MHATAERLATLIEEAPRWARMELNASNPRVRSAAACELADYLVANIDKQSASDPGQLALPL